MLQAPPHAPAWSAMLRDVLTWSGQLQDVMCALPGCGGGSGRGAKRVHPPMPGGEALALRVRASDGSDPASVVRDWALKLRRDLREPVPLHRPMEGEVRFMLRHLDALRGLPWATECWRELQGVWTRLGEAVGHLREEPTAPEPRSPESLADEVPDTARLKLAEAEQFWPGISGRVRTARSRHRARSARRSYVYDPEAGPAQPDDAGRYAVADLRRWHLHTSP